MSVSLNGATVLVTGANGGLGSQFVQQAIDLGAKTVYATARQPRHWDINGVVPLRLDVTDEDSVAEAAAAAAETNVVVNNAAISPYPDRLLTLPIADVRRTFEVNFFGALSVSRAFAPVLAANGGGAFINVGSVLSWVVGDPVGPTGGHGAYSATKAAFWSATNSMRLDLAAQRTHVLSLHLGYTDTPMTAMLDVAKQDPAVIVKAAYDGLRSGAFEVLADDFTRTVKGALARPPEDLYPQLSRDDGLAT